MTALQRIVGLAGALLLAACTATETGNPPSLDPEALSLEMTGGIGFGQIDVLLDDDAVPADSFVTFTIQSLDTDTIPIRTDSDAGEQLRVSIPVIAFQTLRVLIEVDGERYAPLDFRLAGDGPSSLEPLAPPPECVRGAETTGLIWPPDGVASLSLTNRCDGPISVETTTVRGEVTATPTLALEPGERGVLILQGGARPVEEGEGVLRISIAGAATGEAFVTLFQSE